MLTAGRPRARTNRRVVLEECAGNHLRRGTESCPLRGWHLLLSSSLSSVRIRLAGQSQQPLQVVVLRAGSTVWQSPTRRTSMIMAMNHDTRQVSCVYEAASSSNTHLAPGVLTCAHQQSNKYHLFTRKPLFQGASESSFFSPLQKDPTPFLTLCV